MNEWGPSEWAAVVGLTLAILAWVIRGERRAGTYVNRQELEKALRDLRSDNDARLDKQDKALDKIADRIEVNFSEARKEWNKESDFRHEIASTVAAMGAKLEVMVHRELK